MKENQNANYEGVTDLPSRNVSRDGMQQENGSSRSVTAAPAAEQAQETSKPDQAAAASKVEQVTLNLTGVT